MADRRLPLQRIHRRGARKFSFLPIIASGKDTCVLHYIQNSKRCEDGALVLMDIGTEYGNYNSDMTRTVPVNGKFTPRPARRV